MNKDELLERYEALGEEGDFLAAKRLFERDLTRQSSAQERRQYGYLLECHGRYAIRRAVGQYERSMALDPGADKVRYQWMGTKRRSASRRTRSPFTGNGWPAHRGRARAALPLHRLPHGPRLPRGERSHPRRT